MRTRLSWVLTALGALSAVAGLALMVILGPDSRFSTGPHEVVSDGIAVVTAPKVITWADVRIDVLAEVPVQKPVFVGLGNSVDVQNYVSATARLEVTDFHTPWEIKTRQIEGKPGLPGAPTALDWWLAKSAGRGGASITTTLPDETVSLAILSVGDSTLSGLKVSIAYGIKGGFAKGIGLLLLGAGAILLSRLMRRGDDSLWVEEQDDDEDVIYVYVDEDGVEHELSAEEAAEYEIVDADEAGEVEDADREPEQVAASAPPGAPVTETKAEDDEEVVYIYVDEDGVEHEITAEEAEAYEFVDEVTVEVDGDAEPEPEPQPDPEPEPEPEPEPQPVTAPAPERVMYVYVDEDGVEHEVSEEELADFEVIEDSDIEGGEGKP